MSIITKEKLEKSYFVFTRDNISGRVKKIVAPSEMQIGLEANPADLVLFGGLCLNSVTLTAGASNRGYFQLKNSDTVASIITKGFSSPISISLPTPSKNGQIHVIKDATGQAATYNINIQHNNLIDGSTSKSITDNYGAMALYWADNTWHVYSKTAVSGSVSGSVGAPIDAQYITLANNSTLTNERKLTVSNDFVLADSGSNSNVSIQLSQILSGSPGPGKYLKANVTVTEFGRVQAIENGGPVTSAPRRAASDSTAVGRLSDYLVVFSGITNNVSAVLPTSGMTAGDTFEVKVDTNENWVADIVPSTGLIESFASYRLYPSESRKFVWTGSTYEVLGSRSGGWIKIFELDFTAQGSQTFSSNTTYTIAGRTWTKINSANDRVALALTAGTGLVISPAATSNYAAGVRTLPAMTIPMSSFFGNSGLSPNCDIRIWVYWSHVNAAANNDAVVFALESSAAGDAQHWYSRGYFGGVDLYQKGINLTGTASSTALDASDARDVMILDVSPVSATVVRGYRTTYSTGWGGSLEVHDTSVQLANTTLNHWRMGSAAQLLLGAQRNGSGSATYVATIKRIKIEARAF